MDIRQPIKNIMTRNLTYVRMDTSVEEISKIFETEEFHHLPVVDQDGQVAGMISKSDYFKLMDSMSIFNTTGSQMENKKMFKTLLAGEIMNARAACIHEDASVESAIQIFVENRFRALPVVAEDKIIGIVTPVDVMKEVLRHPADLDTKD